MYAKLALAIAPLVYLARADVNLDRDDVPTACEAICDPIVELTRTCDTDLRGDRDRVEDRLEAQCVCTNDSFDVAQVAALCADCLRQNRRADDDDDDDDVRDDTEDIDNILYTCGFSSTTYVASAASAIVESITVEATRPTDESQLSTTIDGQGGTRGTDTGSSPTATDSNDNSDDSNDSTATDTAANADETNAAAGLAPYGVAGAVIAAAMMLA